MSVVEDRSGTLRPPGGLPAPPLEAITEEEGEDAISSISSSAITTPASFEGSPVPLARREEEQPRPAARPWPSYVLLPLFCAGMTISAVLSTLSSEHLKVLHFKAPLVLGGLIPLGTGALGLLTGGLKNRRGPLQAHFICGVLVFGAFWLGATAQTYLSSDSFLILKASRLLPTMLIGLALNKRYLPADWAAALMAIVGLTLVSAKFGSSPAKDSPAGAVLATPPTLAAAIPIPTEGLGWAASLVGSTSTLGYVTVILSLFMDAFYSNVQAELCAQHGSTAQELAAGGMGVAAFIFSAAAALDPASRHGLSRAVEEPSSVGYWLAMFTAANVLGAFSALLLVERFGAASAGFSSVLAKSTSIGVLLFIFPRDLVVWQFVGMAMVLGAVLLSSAVKAPGSRLGKQAAGSEVDSLPEHEHGDEAPVDDDEEEEEEEAEDDDHFESADLEGGMSEEVDDEAGLLGDADAGTVRTSVAGAASMPALLAGSSLESATSVFPDDAASLSSQFRSPVSVRSTRFSAAGPASGSSGSSSFSAPRSTSSAGSRRYTSPGSTAAADAAAPATSSSPDSVKSASPASVTAEQLTVEPASSLEQPPQQAQISSKPPAREGGAPVEGAAVPHARLARSSSLSHIIIAQLPKWAGIERPDKPTLDRLSPLAAPDLASPPSSSGPVSAGGARKESRAHPFSFAPSHIPANGQRQKLTTRSQHPRSRLSGEHQYRRSPLSGGKGSVGGLPPRPKSVSVLGLGSGERGEQLSAESDDRDLEAVALPAGNSTASMPEARSPGHAATHRTHGLGLSHRRNSTGGVMFSASTAAAAAAVASEPLHPANVPTIALAPAEVPTVDPTAKNPIAPDHVSEAETSPLRSTLRSTHTAPGALHEAVDASPASSPASPTTGTPGGAGASQSSPRPEDAVYLLAAGLRHRSKGAGFSPQ